MEEEACVRFLPFFSFLFERMEKTVSFFFPFLRWDVLVNLHSPFRLPFFFPTSSPQLRFLFWLEV